LIDSIKPGIERTQTNVEISFALARLPNVPRSKTRDCPQLPLESILPSGKPRVLLRPLLRLRLQARIERCLLREQKFNAGLPLLRCHSESPISASLAYIAGKD
jgi:hypothetical protein